MIKLWDDTEIVRDASLHRAMGLPSRSEVIEELARQKLAELEAIANDDTAA